MHAFIGNVALVLSVVLGLQFGLVALCILLGGNSLPRNPPEPQRKTGAVGLHPASRMRR